MKGANMYRLGHLFVFALGLFLAVSSAAAEERTIAVLDGREISITTPSGWSFAESRDPRTGLPTIRCADRKEEISLQITFFPDPKAILETREGLEANMKEYFASYLSGAVEKEMTITSLDVPDGVGAYTSFTDRKLVGKKVPESERLISTTGMRSWKGAFLLFTLLTNSRDTEAYRQALEIVESGIRQVDGPRAEASTADRPQLTAAGAPWVMTLPVEGFEVREQKQSADGRSEYYLLTNVTTGFTVSAFIEPAEKCSSSRECRDIIQKTACTKLGKTKNVRASEIGDVSTVECFVPKAQGVALEQQHVFAQYVVQGYWIDMHISKVRYTEADRAGFEQLVKGVSFVPKEKAP
jgi:hypothetical protein